MFRLLLIAIALTFVSFRALAGMDEDFPKDGRYKDLPGVKPVIPLNTDDPPTIYGKRPVRT